MSRRKLIIILLIVFVIIPLVSFVVYLALREPEDTTGQEVVYIDKDTGEEVSTFSGVNPETVDGSDVLLLGMEPLNESIIKEHYNFVRDQINIYSKDRLKNTYDVIALLPGDFKNDSGNVTGNLRLGREGDTIVPIRISSSRFTGEVRVIIDDPENRFGGQFDSGVVKSAAD